MYNNDASTIWLDNATFGACCSAKQDQSQEPKKKSQETKNQEPEPKNQKPKNQEPKNQPGAQEPRAQEPASPLPAPHCPPRTPHPPGLLDGWKQEPKGRHHPYNTTLPNSTPTTRTPPPSLDGWKTHNHAIGREFVNNATKTHGQGTGTNARGAIGRRKILRRIYNNGG